MLQPFSEAGLTQIEYKMGYFNFPSLCSGKSLHLNLIYAAPVKSSNSIARMTLEAETGVRGLNETTIFSSIQLYSALFMNIAE
jgi:hypothetical protein